MTLAVIDLKSLLVVTLSDLFHCSGNLVNLGQQEHVTSENQLRVKCGRAGDRLLGAGQLRETLEAVDELRLKRPLELSLSTGEYSSDADEYGRGDPVISW